MTGLRLAQAASCPSNGPQNIAEIIRTDPTGQLSVLLDLAFEADVLSLLGSVGPINVIAPVDTAFGVYLQEGNITEEKLWSQTNVLDRIMRYHIVNDGAVCDGEPLGSVPSALGDSQRLIFDGKTIIDENGNVAKVISSVPASNGRLFVVDRVLTSSWDGELSEEELEILCDAFDTIDTSDDERVTVEELVSAASERGVTLTEEQIEDWIAADANGSLDLDFEEFLDTLSRDDD